MEKGIKVHDYTHADINSLVAEWKAPSMKEAIAKMAQYCKEHHINPFEKKPLSVGEEIAKLKDTVIGYHKTAEKKQQDKLQQVMAHDRIILEQNEVIIKKSIDRDSLQNLDNRIKKVLDKNVETQNYLIEKVNEAISISKYRKEITHIIEVGIDEILKSPRKMTGGISEEAVKNGHISILSNINRIK
jgi:aminoglycoside phosphotransferase family enzyme